MRNTAPLAAGVAIVTALLATTIADARVIPVPNQVRLEGYVGPPPEGRREVADLLLRVGQREVRFQVTNARVLQGTTSTSSMFRQVRPFRPNFTLRGRRELMDLVSNAAPAARLRIFAVWRTGTRDLSLSSVETLPPSETPIPGKPPAAP